MRQSRCSITCSAVLLLGLCACTSAPRAALTGVEAASDRVRAVDLNEQGLALVKRGQWAEAESRFRQALRADPFHGQAHCNLGVVLLQQAQFYPAALALQDACRLMPQASQPRANLGLLFEAVGQYGKAEDELRQALSRAPEDVEVMGQLARIHARQGKCDSETRQWLEAVAYQDDNGDWRDWARRQLLDRSLAERDPQRR